MQRTFGITLTAIAAAIGAVFGLLFLVLGISSLLVDPPESPGLNPAMLRVGLAMSGLMALVFTVAASATAIGLWKLRAWARWSVLIYSGFLIFMGITSGAMMTVLPLPPTPNAPEGLMETMRLGLITFYAVLAVLGGIWIYYFTRPSVRSLFTAANPRSAPSLRPLSITIIGAYLLFIGASSIATAFAPIPAMVLGFTFGGAPGRLFYVVFGAAYAWVGFGLLRLKPVSRIAALALFAYGILNGLVFLIIPGLQDRIMEFTRDLIGPAAATGIYDNPMFTSASMLLGCVISTIPIWFLVKRREAFVPKLAPAAE